MLSEVSPLASLRLGVFALKGGPSISKNSGVSFKRKDAFRPNKSILPVVTKLSHLNDREAI
jgi:hypothetical protein